VNDVVLVYDDGPRAGLGHRRRIEALADAFHNAGLQVDTRRLDAPVKAECIVVDSYCHRADDRTMFDGAHIVAVDDLDRDLAVDVLVDPSPGSTSDPHKAARCVLAGAPYALIGPGLPNRALPVITERATRVLVTLGGTDQHGLGLAIAHAVASTGESTEVTLAVGPWATPAADAAVRTVHVDDGLGPWLAESDIVVTAGGVTLLEAMYLGRPTVALQIAANQRRGVSSAVRAGAAVEAEPEPRAVAELVSCLAQDAARRRRLSACAHQMIDGRGPKRVVDSILAETRI
jgi:spore coat polysaccharide biosynthesis predicted glycosyltransferase SpsG